MKRVLLVLAVIACRPATPAAPPDPFEAAVQRLERPGTRSAAFEELYTLFDDRPEDEAFATVVIPAFARIWDDAPDYRLSMLSLLAELGRPEGAPVWARALSFDDGPGIDRRVRLAVAGIRRAEATALGPRLADALERLAEDPTLDEDGSLRVALCEILGEFRDRGATPVLRRVLRTDGAPATLYRAAAQALGRVGDPKAVDDLLTLSFRVVDSPSYDNTAEQARRALAQIGALAVPAARLMLRGEHRLVEAVALDKRIARPRITMAAARILGAIGSADAVPDLVAAIPDCEATVPDHDPSTVRLRRRVIAEALGEIGDAAAVAPLCRCVATARTQEDLPAMLEALGRIGGAEALACLEDEVRTGRYDDPRVLPELQLAPRWVAARWAVLAARPEDLSSVQQAMSSNVDQPLVVTELGRLHAGIKTAARCRDNRACHLEALDEREDRDWFTREVAAFALARIAPGDLTVAEAIAGAYDVPRADARVSMALLALRVAGSRSCPKCTIALGADLERGGTLGGEFRRAELIGRIALARLDRR